MEDFLDSRLPRILPENCTFGIHPHQGKHALLRRLEARLRGYSSWMPNNCRIIVVVDRDSDDCKELKFRLEECCKNAGLQSKRTANNPNWQVVTRIVIEELEAWYFGDWQAVRAAYPRVSTDIRNKRPAGIPMRFRAALRRHSSESCRDTVFSAKDWPRNKLRPTSENTETRHAISHTASQCFIPPSPSCVKLDQSWTGVIERL